MIQTLFHTSQFGKAGNRAFYSNPKVDQLLDDGKTTTDPAAREALYKEAQVIIRDEAPWIFVQDGENVTATRKNVQGFKHHPTGSYFLSQVKVGE